MNIGIDIDGVLTDFERELMDYSSKMAVEEGWAINVDLTAYDESKALGWNQDQIQKFWNRYIIKYFKDATVRNFAPEVIEKLKKEGHKIYFITARDDYGMPIEHYGEEQQITKDWLEKNNIRYDKIIFETEKLQPCIENNIDVIIEDSPHNIQELSKQIKVIKFDCPYNRDVSNENVTTAYSWYHIFRIIKEMEGK